VLGLCCRLNKELRQRYGADLSQIVLPPTPAQPVSASAVSLGAGVAIAKMSPSSALVTSPEFVSDLSDLVGAPVLAPRPLSAAHNAATQPAGGKVLCASRIYAWCCARCRFGGFARAAAASSKSKAESATSAGAGVLRHTSTAVELRFSSGTVVRTFGRFVLPPPMYQAIQRSGTVQLVAETDTCTPTQARLVATPSTDRMGQSNETGSEGRDSSSRRTKAALLALVHCEVPTHRRDSSCPRNVTGQATALGDTASHLVLCSLRRWSGGNSRPPTSGGAPLYTTIRARSLKGRSNRIKCDSVRIARHVPVRERFGW
jgi:hypothetical protein